MALLPDLLAAARRAAPRLDPSGLRMRLAHAIGDAETAHGLDRGRAIRAVRRAAAASLGFRRPRRVVLAAAAAADPGCVLSDPERDAIVLDALIQALRTCR